MSKAKDNESTIQEWIKALGDDDFGVRQNAAWELGNPHAGDKAAVPALVKVLKGDAPALRRLAADALGNIGGPAAILALEKALKDDKDPEVCRSAARALGAIGSPAAIPALVKVLKGDAPALRRLAAWALGKIGDEAIPALEKALKDDKDPAVRRYIQEQLTRLKERVNEQGKGQRIYDTRVD